MSLSPTSTPIGILSPVFIFLEPGPTANTSPSAVCPCSAAVSGKKIPLSVCSCLSGFYTKTLASKGSNLKANVSRLRYRG